MDCNNARLLLEFARPVPGELDAAEAAAFREHLDQCPDCGALAGSEQRLDAAIGRTMQAVPIPDGLRLRLMNKLDRQRDAWYRRFVSRRVLPAAAAAAAVVLVVYLGAHWKQQQRVRLDLTVAQESANDRHHARRDAVDKWLSGMPGETAVAPPQFDYDKLDHFCVTELQNQRVPTLLFVRPNTGDSAWVYVLNDKRFDLQKLIDEKNQLPDGGNSGVVRVAVLQNQQAKLAYLVLYTGSELDRFFPENPPVAH